MKVHVALSVSYIKQEDILKKTAIVIDTLRATSTIITALQQGAAKVIPVETVGQALQHSDQHNVILIGERNGKKVYGFDGGNSPVELQKFNVRDKTIVLTTTNGTKAIHKAKRAAHILIGCLLNAQDCIEKAISLKKDIVMLCSGRRGDFAIEDGITAGFMIHLLKQKKGDIQLCDTALMLEHNYAEHEANLFSLVQQGDTGKQLIETGQEEDIHYCLQLNHTPLTGIYLDEGIVPYTKALRKHS